MAWEITPQYGRIHALAPANFFDWRRQAMTFEALAAIRQHRRHAPGTRRARAGARLPTHPPLFKVMGVRPAMGRTFTAEETPPGVMT